MRILLLICLGAATLPAQAAPDCPSLALSFLIAPAAMTVTALAQTRTCVDGTAWVAVIPKAASAAGSGKDPWLALLKFQVSQACTELSRKFAEQGSATMSEANRSVLRKCIVDAITVISAQPRPGTEAYVPTPPRGLFKEGQV